jgi:hypothetical protein
MPEVRLFRHHSPVTEQEDAMFRRQIFNSQLAEQLKPVARQNVQFMREYGALVRNARDFKMARRVDEQARRWAQITVEPPKRKG